MLQALFDAALVENRKDGSIPISSEKIKDCELERNICHGRLCAPVGP